MFFTRLLAYLSIYALVIARWGYEYGRNDQMQILGYAKYLANKALFPHDNYIQGMAEKVPNERFAFSWLMSLTSSWMELFSLIGHIIVSLLMFHLLYKIASRFIKTDYLSWLCILFIFIPLYNVNLGGNEMWYNTFFVSNVVKLAGLWAMWLFLNDKFIIAFLFIGLSVLLQPVVGVQLFVTLTGMMVAMKAFRQAETSWQTIITSVMVFILTGGVWVVFLKLFFEEASVLTNAEFFNILFEFRSPHHYLPFAFSLKSWLILVPLMIFGGIYYWKTDKALGWFFVVSLPLLLGYILMVEALEVVNVASLQWFKITICLEAFSVIALFAFAERHLIFIKNKHLVRLSLPILSLAGMIAAAVIVFRPSLLPWNIPMDFGQQQTNDPAVEICIQAKAKTPEDALFIHPMAFTELKVYGERSSFVEWKILVHRKNAMKQWYDRLSMLYGIGLGDDESGFELYADADINFKALDTASLTRMSEMFGITHILTWKDHQLDFPTISENEKFRIYQLNLPDEN